MILQIETDVRMDKLEEDLNGLYLRFLNLLAYQFSKVLFWCSERFDIMLWETY